MLDCRRLFRTISKDLYGQLVKLLCMLIHMCGIL